MTGETARRERVTSGGLARWRPRGAAGWLRVALVACAVVALGLALLARLTAPTPGGAQALVGRPAPGFTLPAAQGGHKLAQPITFAPGVSGRPTLLVFFNTLCVHCIPGVQVAHAVATSAAAPVDVVYIDTPGENAQITGQYMTRLQLDPPVALDAGERVAARYGVAYYPTLILLDQRGVVRAAWTGEPSASAVSAALARLR